MKTALPLCSSLLALLLANSGALAQTVNSANQSGSSNTTGQNNQGKPSQPVETIDITAHRQLDIDERRDSAVAKIVVGHEEIMKYGDINIGDVLKRLPGVTIGGPGGRTGGEIRMRGLGSGYTQILINGEPAPRGFALDSISPELIERIEIFRAPLAEHSAQSVAGTINIVLRQVPVRLNKEFTVTESLEDNAHPESRLALQYNDKAGKFSWLLSGTVKEMGQLEGENYAHNLITTAASATAPAAVTEDQITTDHQYRNGYNANIAPRLNWRNGEDDTASVQLFAFRRAAVDQSFDTMDDTIGTPRYSSQIGHSINDSDVYKLTVDRVLPLAGGSFKGTLSLSDFNSNVDTHYLQNTINGPQALESESGNRVNGGNTAGKWTYPVNDHNKFVMGYEGDWSSQTSTLMQNGYIANAPPQVNETSATVVRLAGYAQDEWNVSDTWGWYAGLRWESIATRSTDVADNDISNRSDVLSPSLQSVWRFGEKNGDGHSDQVRWSLARTYRAPGTNSLLPRIQLSTMNDAFHPDTEGNPNLKPELSWGMDAAYEHYLKDGGMVSVSLFERDVSDVIRTLTTLQSNGRWIAQPINLDHAQVYGIEIDGKMRMDQLIGILPQVELHANAARYWSQVSGIPGPYNYLGGQIPASANAGFDYVESRAISMGANVTWVPSYTTQLSPTQQSFTGGKTGLDSYVLWKFMPGWQFRLAATNLWHPDYIGGGLNDSNDMVNTNTTVAHTWVNWMASLNVRF
ncbi:MAG: TonB-dependent receptor [Burkholderiaceae bacterium]|nr:TonB-dependent receptor [Burkholderiaceae bacterium]